MSEKYKKDAKHKISDPAVLSNASIGGKSASAYDLGTLLELYPGDKLGHYITGFSGFFLFGTWAFFEIWFLANKLELHQSVTFWQGFRIALSLLSVGLFIRVLLKKFNVQVAVFEKGFTITEKEKTDAIRWEQVDSTYQFFSIEKTSLGKNFSADFRVVLKDGKKYCIDNEKFKKITDLVMSIQNHVTQIILPVLVEKINAGETIQFGPVSLKKSGIIDTASQQYLNWGNAPVMFGGNVNFFVSGNDKNQKFAMKSIPVKQVPNVYAFLSISAQVYENTVKRQQK